jgi:hypothetical protein
MVHLRFDGYHLPDNPVTLYWHLCKLIGPKQAVWVIPREGKYALDDEPFVELSFPFARLTEQKSS